eukprot:TRINITY_DN1341_c2_g1_i1.p1 TRINITY_DN1341_c2_g1~~TRINITY_DN1341_c2_g1_i1.p1  ORF type:complete len:348 (+),score=142.50 TRINITY_DN1341_c2_g1_i1:75-1118(+)
MSDSARNQLIFLGFNQDSTCFACGTEKGFIIYNCDPLKERFRREFENGGIGIVEMLFRCNILALVGGGKCAKYPTNKVMIWDDFQNKCIAELEFRSDVKAVRLRRDRVVVVLLTKVYVYNFSDLQLMEQFDTCENPRGLCALSPSTSNTVIAYPDVSVGGVKIQLADSKSPLSFMAHNTALSQLALNSDGTLLATSSEKGTLIRIFDTNTGNRVREVRRGADRADIYSLSFNQNSRWLCVSSDKGTVHIYAVSSQNQNQNQNQNSQNNNRHSSLFFMKDLLPSYWSSEWSFAQFRIPETRSLCTFSNDKNSVIVININGDFYKYTFDPVRGGEARLEMHSKFLQDAD